MKLVTTEQMQALEAAAAAAGISPDQLMERAGRRVAGEVARLLGGTAGQRILVLIGPGNNGGDGLVAARCLHDAGAQVQLFLSRPRNEDDANFAAVAQRNISRIAVPEGLEGFTAFETALAQADLVLDALLGTGRTRPLEGAMSNWLLRVRQEQAQRPGLKVVALDLPSGVDADSGQADPNACPADLTVTLGYPKVGLYTFPGAALAGRVTTVDIGLPAEAAQEFPVDVMTEPEMAALLPRRPADANKGSFGRVMVVAGSMNYIGAAALACQGAMRAGAGLVTLATAQGLHPILAQKLTEVTHLPLPEAEPGVIRALAFTNLHQHLANYQVLLCGCGLGQAAPVREFLRGALLGAMIPLPPMVLDADALNTLADISGWWERLEAQAILTPHPGEMARLRQLPVDEVQDQRLAVVREAAIEWGQVVVLKGAHSVVANPGGRAWVSPFANPGLASAGTGDVLAGVIAGLLSQGLSTFDAAALGVFLHGLAGELARQELGQAGIIATDLLPRLPLAWQRLASAPDL